MRRLSISLVVHIFCGIIVIFAITWPAWAGSCPKCKHEPVLMPLSLGAGTTIRTPQFLVKKIGYNIAIRVNRGLPFNQLSCMIGGKGHPSHCDMYHWENVIDAEWKVLDGEHVVAQGTTLGYGDMAWSGDVMDRYIGQFDGEANKKYVVEVRFTKDGTPLNEFQPHLIVRMFDTFW